LTAARGAADRAFGPLVEVVRQDPVVVADDHLVPQDDRVIGEQAVGAMGLTGTASRA
jgi:hypothetical protein